MPQVPSHGVEASILVDGKPLEEYKVEIDGNKAKCYVESTSGKQFQIKYQPITSALTGDYDLRVKFVLDGTGMDSVIGSKHKRAVSKGRRVTQSSRQPYLFSNLSLSDEDNACSSEKVIKRLGCIQIKLYRVIKKRYIPYPSTRHQAERENNVFNENSKKARLSHQTCLGKTVPTKSVQRCVEYDAVDKRHWFEFQFFYRSRVLLELEGIIPPTVAHAVEELQEVAPIHQVKGTDFMDVDVKREVKREKKKRPLGKVQGEPIDLDDDEPPVKRVKKEKTIIVID
ncbi:hypothetical protein BT69DRAFT_1324740 [Atractiella rhizophila]|nr:hypothetical protein BT69DRAFT_1324740 [Atractiella rhizophila]